MKLTIKNKTTIIAVLAIPVISFVRYNFVSTGDAPDISLAAVSVTANSSAQAIVYNTTTDDSITVVPPLRDRKIQL